MGFKNYASIVILTLGFTFCVSGQEKRLAKADQSFKELAYIDARKIYLNVAEDGYTSPDLFKKLGDSYYFNGDLENAVVWYEKLATSYPNDLEPEYIFRYSQGLKSVKRYEDADKAMEQFNTITGSDKRAANFMSTRDYLDFIELQSGKFNMAKLSINSKYSDFAPSFRQGELVFASARGQSVISKSIHEWNEKPLLNLFSGSRNDNGKVGEISKLRGKINTKLHESSTTFTQDGNTVYFTRNNYTKRKIGKDANGTILLKLYRATFENGKWIDVEELPFNSDEYSVSHPALSQDGSKLYFASDMPGTKGLSDIFMVDVNTDGSFGTPKNLGDKINTEGRETFPYISDIGRLYFASDGHVGLGGLDVFVAVPEDDEFSIPYNVGKPINSPDDDFTFVINEQTKLGYFASNRKGGKGSDDIYSFKQTDELITSCQQYVSGLVTDAKTGDAIADVDVILLDGNNVELERAKTDVVGNYKFEVSCESSYIIRAVKEAYGSSEAPLNTTDVFEFTHNVPLTLGDPGLTDQGVGIGDDLAKILQIEPIYFDFDKSFIRPDAEIELQKVISAMKQYPQLNIDVRSHTDSRGDDNYNRALSDRRAKSTVKYIVEKGGIDSNRISGEGYGESNLTNECKNNASCSEAQHQLNRRSEFIIVK